MSLYVLTKSSSTNHPEATMNKTTTKTPATTTPATTTPATTTPTTKTSTTFFAGWHFNAALGSWWPNKAGR